MKTESQQIAIADDPRFQDKLSRMAIALGYEFDPMRGPLNYVWHKGEEDHTHDWFNRYFNDLNAMHAGVQSQSEDFRKHFNEALLSVARQRNGLVVDLTAKDWADVFVYCISQRT